MIGLQSWLMKAMRLAPGIRIKERGVAMKFKSVVPHPSVSANASGWSCLRQTSGGVSVDAWSSHSDGLECDLPVAGHDGRLTALGDNDCALKSPRVWDQGEACPNELQFNGLPSL